MEAPFYFIDEKSNAIEKSTSLKNADQKSSYTVNFASQKTGGTTSLSFLCQYFDAYLSYLELYEFNCSMETGLRFKVDAPVLLLCFVINGQFRIDGRTGSGKIRLKTRDCTGILFSSGIYEQTFQPGNHTILFISADFLWLRSLNHINHLFSPYLQEFLKRQYDSLMLPTKRINGLLSIKLRRLLLLKVKNYATLSASVQLAVAGIIDVFHDLLATEQEGQQTIPYRILEFIGINYRNPDLSNKVIASMLHSTADTVTKQFRKEFKMTPHVYITHLRMQLARDMLTGRQYPIADIYRLCGYRDPHTFRVQFKNHFGLAPGKYADVNR